MQRYTEIVETDEHVDMTGKAHKVYRVDFKVNHQRFMTIQDANDETAEWYQLQLTKSILHMLDEQNVLEHRLDTAAHNQSQSD